MAQPLQQRMYTMLTNNTLTDVTFIVQGEEIKGHKAVIASYGGLLKEYVEKNNQIIDVGDIISPETFKAVLKYIYTDEIAITKSNILEILHAATKFSLKSLEQMCVKHLAKRLSCGNLEEMSKQASLFKSQELLNVCTQYFGNNTQRIIESKEFLAFSEDVLKTLCSSHQIDCLDVELFSSCVKWAENRCKSLNRQCTPENLRIALGDTLQKIRFSSMSMEEFLESVVKTKILTVTEVGQSITDILDNKDKPKSPHCKRVFRDEADTMASEAQVTEAEADGAAKEAHVTKEADAPANVNTCVCDECNFCTLQQETGIMSCHTTAATDVPVSPLVNQGLVQPCCSNIKDQWSPINVEGKKHYDREFLMQLRFSKASMKKPDGLPKLPEVILDKPLSRHQESRHSMSSMRGNPSSSVDFTPGFLKAMQREGFGAQPLNRHQEFRHSMNSLGGRTSSPVDYTPGFFIPKQSEGPDAKLLNRHQGSWHSINSQWVCPFSGIDIAPGFFKPIQSGGSGAQSHWVSQKAHNKPNKNKKLKSKDFSSSDAANAWD